MPRISREREKSIAEAYLSGKTRAEVAEEFEHTEKTIGIVLKRQCVKTRSNRTFDDETEEQICLAYQEKATSLAELGREYGVAYQVIARVLDRHGVPRKSPSVVRRQYPINETFFDQVDTEEKAYILGLLYADGGNVGPAVYLVQHIQDRDIVEKTNALLQPEKPVRMYNTGKTTYLRMTISNKYVVRRLTQLGIVQRKSDKITWPDQLPEEQSWHFLRGYFDGDGTAYINPKTGRMYVGFVGTKPFLKSIKKLFRIKSIGGSIYKVQRKRAHRLRVCGNRQVMALLDRLYKEATIYGNRKYAKYQELKRIRADQPRSGRSVLSADQVREIRRRYDKEEVTQTMLAEAYHVSQNAISNLLLGKTYIHVK